jgi:collagen type II alpha
VDTKAAQDPFLMEITPDGVPLEEATTCDLR